MPLPNIGLPELIIILVIALLVIGPGKLPEVGTALGKSIREFRKAASDVQDAASLDPTPKPVAAAQPVAPAQVAPVQPAPAAPVQAAPIAPAEPVPAPATPAPAAPAVPEPNVLTDAAAPNEIAQPRA